MVGAQFLGMRYSIDAILENDNYILTFVISIKIPSKAFQSVFWYQYQTFYDLTQLSLCLGRVRVRYA